MTELKRLEMDKENAGKLARALNNANQHIRIPMLNSRTAALAILAWTAARIYLPMAKDVMAEMNGLPQPAQVQQAPLPQPVPTMAGTIVPVPADDANLDAWLPTVRN